MTANRVDSAAVPFSLFVDAVGYGHGRGRGGGRPTGNNSGEGMSAVPQTFVNMSNCWDGVRLMRIYQLPGWHGLAMMIIFSSGEVYSRRREN